MELFFVMQNEDAIPEMERARALYAERETSYNSERTVSYVI